MVISNFGTEVAEIDISSSMNDQSEHFLSNLTRQNLTEARLLFPNSPQRQALFDTKAQLDVYEQDKLVERLIEQRQFKKLAEIVVMRTQRDEKYVLDNVGSLRQILLQRLDGIMREEVRELLKMSRYYQLNYNSYLQSDILETFKK